MPAERIPRRHELFFSPRDYLNDPAVLAMNTLARGVYSTLLFAAWDLDKPGVVPANDTALASLARCTPDEWAATRDQVAAAFDTSKPGVWLQRRMVREHERQTSWIRRQKAHGKAGRNKQLVGLPRATPRATPGPTSVTPVTPVSPVDKETPTPTARRLRAGKPRSARIPAQGIVGLPTNTGELWHATEDEVLAWEAAYPALDVRGTITEARAWLVSNPNRRKTWDGMPRFVNGWLSREQNRA